MQKNFLKTAKNNAEDNFIIFMNNNNKKEVLSSLSAKYISFYKCLETNFLCVFKKDIFSWKLLFNFQKDIGDFMDNYIEKQYFNDLI